LVPAQPLSAAAPAPRAKAILDLSSVRIEPFLFTATLFRIRGLNWLT
jgi:hypothetical protein